MRSVAFHKTQTNMLENELFPATAVQQRQYVDAVGRRTYSSGLISMFAFCKSLPGAFRFVTGAYVPPPPNYGPARNKDKQAVQAGTVNTAIQYLRLPSDATNRTCIHQYPNSIIMYASQVPYLYHPCSSFSAPPKNFVSKTLHVRLVSPNTATYSTHFHLPDFPVDRTQFSFPTLLFD